MIRTVRGTVKQPRSTGRRAATASRDASERPRVDRPGVLATASRVTCRPVAAASEPVARGPATASALPYGRGVDANAGAAESARPGVPGQTTARGSRHRILHPQGGAVDAGGSGPQGSRFCRRADSARRPSSTARWQTDRRFRRRPVPVRPCRPRARPRGGGRPREGSDRQTHHPAGHDRARTRGGGPSGKRSSRYRFRSRTCGGTTSRSARASPGPRRWMCSWLRLTATPSTRWRP